MRAKPHIAPGGAASLNQRARTRSRGVAAVEFAVILPVLILLLVFPIFFARVLMSYSVAQKAAHDTALILARIPRSETRTEAFFKANIDSARSNAEAEVEGLYPGAGNSVYVTVLCDDVTCGPSVPNNIRINVQLRMFDDFFWFLTGPFVGSEGILVAAEVRMPYLGK